MAVITQAGIGWTLARTWEGSRAGERQLKRQGGASRPRESIQLCDDERVAVAACRERLM